MPPWPSSCATKPGLNALRQYLQLLAGEAEVVGIDLDAASTPLVQ